MNNIKIKKIEGIVRDNKHAKNKTLFVEIKTQKYNTFYKRNIKSSKIYTVHYESGNPIEIGTKIYITSCRLISKNKAHIVVENQ